MSRRTFIEFGYLVGTGDPILRIFFIKIQSGYRIDTTAENAYHEDNRSRCTTQLLSAAT